MKRKTPPRSKAHRGRFNSRKGTTGVGNKKLKTWSKSKAIAEKTGRELRKQGYKVSIRKTKAGKYGTRYMVWVSK